MTLQEAKSIARHFGLTLRLLRSGNYRVNYGGAGVARFRDAKVPESDALLTTHF